MAGITNTWDRDLANAWMAAKLGGATGGASPWKVGLLDANGVEYAPADFAGYTRKQISFGTIAPPTTSLRFLMPDDDENVVLQNTTAATWGPWTGNAPISGYVLCNTEAHPTNPLLTVAFGGVNIVNTGIVTTLRKGMITLTLAQLRGR